MVCEIWGMLSKVFCNYNSVGQFGFFILIKLTEAKGLLIPPLHLRLIVHEQDTAAQDMIMQREEPGLSEWPYYKFNEAKPDRCPGRGKKSRCRYKMHPEEGDII